MNPSCQFHVQENRLALRLKTRWLHADLLPAVAIAKDDEAVRTAIESDIRSWQAQGYVLEDACVLALFGYASRALHGVRSLNDSPPKRDAYPRLVDLECGPRPSSVFPAMRNPRPGVYPIVDNLEHLALMLEAGARILQLRIKSPSFTTEIGRKIQQAVSMGRQYPDCQLFINDYWQAAIDAGAWGVHLGQEDLLSADLDAIAKAGLRLGVSSHSFWEVARALSLQPSIVACGPVFPTRVKAMPWIARGTDNLRYWVSLIPYPVIGIGGVNAGNLAEVHATGCASASVIGAVTGDLDPTAAFLKLQSRWQDLETQMKGSVSRHESLLARPTLSVSS
ncbi:MAG: hypothetical protein FGM18_02110 [Burkholderiaceae bacterium]|nr:hypothetical protein [Burkholderiaceae bacterium]